MVTKSFDPLARASATAVSFKQLVQSRAPIARPEIIGLLAQPQTSKTGITYNKPFLSIGNADDIGVISGFGSPMHLAAKKLFPLDKNGAKVPVYIVPIEDPTGGVAAAGDIAITGIATKTFQAFLTLYETEVEAAADVVGKVATNAQLNPAKAPRSIDLNGFGINALSFVISKSDTATDIISSMTDLIDSTPEVPYTYVDNDPTLDLTMKWEGPDGNNMMLDVVDADGNSITSGIYGVDITVTTFTSGAGIPLLTDALAEMTDNFGFTRLITQYSDTTSLDALKSWADGLRDPLIAQYALAYHGRVYPESGAASGTVDVAALKAIGDARNDDSVNVVVGGSFGDSLRALTYEERDLLLKAGISNFEKLSTLNYRVGDIATFYHPDGITNSIFKYDRDITLLGNIAYDQKTYFKYSDEWKSVILVSNDDVTVNPDARSTDDVKAAINKRLDLYGLDAWIANVSEAKKNTVVEIDSSNPNRININLFLELSGVGRIVDITNFVGFFFGAA